MPDENSSLSHAARQVTLKCLENFNKQKAGVRAAENIEFLHEIRVSGRRLVNALWAFEKLFERKDVHKWQRQIKKFNQYVGEARDTDVQIEFLESFKEKRAAHPGFVDELIAALQKKRQFLQKEILVFLDGLEKKNILKAIEKSVRGICPVQEEACFFTESKIAVRLQELRHFKKHVKHPQRAKELHLMRNAVRNLRYTMEVFQSLYGKNYAQFLTALQKMQVFLGKLHDFDVWIKNFPQFCSKHKSGARYQTASDDLARYCKQERQKIYEQFVSFWDACQKNHFWQKLNKVISK